jgi:hypothetical protein
MERRWTKSLTGEIRLSDDGRSSDRKLRQARRQRRSPIKTKNPIKESIRDKKVVGTVYSESGRSVNSIGVQHRRISSKNEIKGYVSTLCEIIRSKTYDDAAFTDTGNK